VQSHRSGLPDPADLALQPDGELALAHRVDLVLVLARAGVALGEGHVIVVEHVLIHALLEVQAGRVGADGHALPQSLIAVRDAAQAGIDLPLDFRRQAIGRLARVGGRILALRPLVEEGLGPLPRRLRGRGSAARRGARAAGSRRRRKRRRRRGAQHPVHLRAEAQRKRSPCRVDSLRQGQPAGLLVRAMRGVGNLYVSGDDRVHPKRSPMRSMSMTSSSMRGSFGTSGMWSAI